jgi:hypothetical protein
MRVDPESQIHSHDLKEIAEAHKREVLLEKFSRLIRRAERLIAKREKFHQRLKREAKT